MDELGYPISVSETKNIKKTIIFFSVLLLFFVISLFFYFFVVLGVNISETEGKQMVSIKGNTYEIINTEPQNIYPAYSVPKYEFDNKIILVRSDLPNSIKNFLKIRNTYWFYFESIENNFIKNALIALPAAMRHPFGFINLVVAKATGKQFGYNATKNYELDEESVREDINIIGQAVEFIENLGAYRVIVLDQKTFEPVLENGTFKQALIFLKNKETGKEAALLRGDGNDVAKPITTSDFNLDYNVAFKISGEKVSDMKDGYLTIYADTVTHISWKYRFVHYNISLLYPGYWKPWQNTYQGSDNGPTQYVEESRLKLVKVDQYTTRYDITGEFFNVKILDSEEDDILIPARNYAAPRKTKTGEYYYYGSKPTLETTKIGGQEAVIIKPSDDQSGESYPKGFMSAIIKYPTPLIIKQECLDEWDCYPGGTTYDQKFSYVVVSADKKFFQDIIDSIVFLSK